MLNEKQLPHEYPSTRPTCWESRIENHFPKLAQKGYVISQLSEIENKKLSSCLDVKQDKRSFVVEKNEKNKKKRKTSL